MTKKHTTIAVLTAMATLAWQGCSDNTDTASEEMTVREERHEEHKLGANVIQVERVAGKGVIKSVNTAAVYSLVDGVVTRMNLVEGQKVRKGQILAEIDRTEATLALMEYESALERKAYDVQTTLMGLGYKRDSINYVPSDVRRRIELMTGYAHEQLKVENQKKLLEYHSIKAPFDGSIMDIVVNRMAYVRKGDPMFYVMDTDNLIIQFEVLENMLPIFSIGMPLEFTTLSYGDKTYGATLLSIAPNVEESGMIRMTARIDGKQPDLRPGMTTFVNY